ncbi:MAG: GTP 3',8-cyclase MoaA [Pseudomonadota bacterium]
MALTDRFNRRVEYLRLSLTDRCNLRCFYCLPKGFRDFESAEERMTDDEIVRLVGIFAELGVSKVRLTGGEPLVRRGMPKLAKRLSSLEGLKDLSMSTNASLLTQYAGELAEAGIDRINVSLDSLQKDRFRTITGGALEPVLDGLEAAYKAGLSPIKINMVALKGINDDEYGDMLGYCLERDFTLRFIETMPMGEAGRLGKEHYLDLGKVKRDLEKRFELIPSSMPGGGPARYYQVKGTQHRIGFITPISQHFCETCNRVRLSADGTLYLCLGQEDNVSLGPMLRNGSTDDEIRDAIVHAIMKKPERHFFNERPKQFVRLMSQTGG